MSRRARETTQETPVLFSFAEEYFAAASGEITEVFPDATIERLGPDLACVTLRQHSADDLVRAVRDVPLVFVKHLSVEALRIPPPEADIAPVAAAARRLVTDRQAAGHGGHGGHEGREVAVQCWVSGEAHTGFGSADLFRAISEELTEHGHPARRAGHDPVLSACIHSRGISLGLATRDQALSDWPGGRVRLARSKNSVSRAEFKLEELLQATSLRLPREGRAVDLGAAPGGWSRILREQGLEVWSVDPGDLAPAVAADPLVHHERTTTGRFFGSIRPTSLRFDVAVNDMRMTPRLSCEAMLEAADVLRPGALAVVTLKLGSKNPVSTVRSCLDVLRRRYQVVFARQLHHNRHEVSVVARSTGSSRSSRESRASRGSRASRATRPRERRRAMA